MQPFSKPMKECKLQILDEVNIRFLDLDVATRRKLVSALEFYVPGAKYLPAVKLGRWNGKVSYCDIGGRSYLNLLDKLLPLVQEQGYNVVVDDNRTSYDFKFDLVDENSYDHIYWPKGHPLEGTPVLIKEHQTEMINLYLQNIQSINVIPTGGGKTLVTGILSHKVQEYGRSIIIVPNRDLVTQTEQDYINLGLDVGVYFGGRKEFGKTHTICTWQSLETLNKGQCEVTIDEFIDGVVCVISDETHRAKGAVLRALLSGPFRNVPIRWGLTGTMPEEELDKLAVISCVGKLVSEIKTSSLQEKGILADIHIHVEQLQDPLVSHPTYQAELKWLTSDKTRLKYISDRIMDIATTGNTLVLVDRIDAGKILELNMEGSIFLSGQTKTSLRKTEYASVQELDNKILVATFGIASTGINVPRIFNLVLIESGKGFVKVIQSIGRGLRVTPDKSFVNVYDICSNAKYSKRHLTRRKQIYTDKGYEFSLCKRIY